MTTTATATTALVAYLIGLAIAFGWRTMVHRRATGDTGYRGTTGRPGSLAWWGAVLFGTALILGVAAPTAVLTDMTPLLARHPALTAVGLATAVAGIGVTLTAQRHMGVSWRVGVATGERTALITGGLFTHVRNPVFTGMLTVTAGLAVMVPTIVSVLALACLLTAVQIQVRAVEEPYLIATHGAAYRGYAANAGRFLPGIGRLTASGTSGSGVTRP